MQEALSTVARDAIDLLAGESASRLRECEADDCTGFYLDASHGAPALVLGGALRQSRPRQRPSRPRASR